MFFGDGWWVIFPIVGLLCMLVMMSRMLGVWGRGSSRGTRMGPMGMMGDHHQQDKEPDGALEVLRRRYASGELTDEEFDAKRRRLEGS